MICEFCHGREWIYIPVFDYRPYTEFNYLGEDIINGNECTFKVGEIPCPVCRPFLHLPGKAEGTDE